jgi:hypothetical protein
MAKPPKDPQKDLLSRRQYLVDLSMVPLLDELRDDLPKGSLLVPETLDKLLRLEQPTDELAGVLSAAVMPNDPTSFEREQFTITSKQLRDWQSRRRRKELSENVQWNLEPLDGAGPDSFIGER